MLNKNAIWVGLLLGLLVPSLLYIILLQIFSILEIKGAASGTGFSENFRERTLAIVALATNLYLLSIYRRRRWDKVMRGIVIGTTMLALAWLYVFGRHLF
jgi:putative effector of murein hydrolase